MRRTVLLRPKLSIPTILFVCLVACSASGGKPAADAPPRVADAANVAQAPAPAKGVEQKPAAESAGPLRVLYVLDASGSMRGKVGSEEKMTAARRVLKESLNKLPDAAEVGLIAYGHRSESDCNDIEVIAPLAALDRAALAQKIDALTPKGKTPITNALQRAFDVVRAQTGERPITIVLVSDGLETCNGDPCALTRGAKAAGLKFVTHVIGFDVGQVSVAQLECVAQAGGGRYFGAQDAGELAVALAGAVAPAEVYDSRLSVKTVVDGKLADAVVTIRQAGTAVDVTSGRTYIAADTNPRVLPLPAGTYDVTVSAVDLAGKPSQRLDGVKVNAGETVEKVFDFSSGTLRIGAKRGSELIDATVIVKNLSTGKEVGLRTYASAQTNPRTFELLPGRYSVRVIAVRPPGLGPQEFTVEVKAGETIERTINF